MKLISVRPESEKFGNFLFTSKILAHSVIRILSLFITRIGNNSTVGHKIIVICSGLLNSESLSVYLRQEPMS